jgi:hypothetical protein
MKRAIQLLFTSFSFTFIPLYNRCSNLNFAAILPMLCPHKHQLMVVSQKHSREVRGTRTSDRIS